MKSTQNEQSTASEQQNQHKSFNYISKSLFAGGIAGCVAKSIVAPLDRVKILFQTSNPSFSKHSGKFLGVFNAIKDIYSQHGILALFQGHSATLIRIFPYAAIKFMSYEQYKIVLMPTKESQTPMRRLLAGSLAGITSVFVSYPLDIIRVRMAFQVRASNAIPTLQETCRSIYHERGPFYTNNVLNGISNFYRGFLPTMYGMIPYAGVSFLTYESLKEKALLLSSCTVPGTNQLSTLAQLSIGGLSGMIAQTSSYPFEIIRRSMQIAGLNSIHRTTLETANVIYASKGMKGFFVGLSIGYIKVIPMFSISFYVYEWMKTELGI